MKHHYPAVLRLSAKLLGLLWFIGLVRPLGAQAQTYSLPATGNTTISTCSGTLYDDGGGNGNYSSYANGSMTITPATAGNKIRLEFSAIAVEPGWDVLYIYDGNSVAAPLIGTFNSSNQPGTVYGTTASGALTVRLTSDGIYQFTGFAATIGCVTTVPPQAQADLAVQGAALSSLSVGAGGSLTANCAIYNLSGTAAASSTVGYYLSSDAVLDAADQLLNSSSGFSLSVGQSSSRFASLTVPAGTAPGSYFVLFAADHLNQVGESNENNNVAAVNMTVTPPSIDLVVQSAYLNSTSVAPGGITGASCYLANQGNSLATPATVGYYLSTNQVLDASDVLLGNTTGPLSGFNSISRYANLTVPVGTATGSYYVLFVADYLGQVTETNENNNVANALIQVVAPSIDLTITQTYLYSFSVAAGSSTGTECAIQNVGNALSPSSTIGYYLSVNQVLDASDVLLKTTFGGPLAGGQSAYRNDNLVIPTGTAAGGYYVLFVADPQNAVTEANKNNNVASRPLQVIAPGIDLLVQNAYLSPTSVAPGNATSTTCSLSNQGNSLANPATVGYYLSTNQVLDASDVLLGNTTGSLSGNNSTSRYANLTIPLGTATGSYYVLFVADYLGQLSETNENNNVASALLQVVAPGIDLTINQPSLSAATITSGSTVNANCSINNIGNAVAASSTVGFYLSTNQILDASDILLNTAPGFALSPGFNSPRFGNLVIPTGTTPGTYYVLFVADPQNTVTETNENNNVVFQLLTVTGPFTGTIVPFSGTATITTCSSTIYDNGGFNSYANNSTGTLTILPATAGAMVQLVFNSFSTETGYDYVRIYNGTSSTAPLLGSYSGNQVPPLTVATNAAGALTVQFASDAVVNAAGFEATVSCVAPPQSDLLFTQIGASPSSVPAGTNLSLTATVANQGAGPAASAAVGYYLSTDQLRDASDVLLGTSPGTALGPNLDASLQLVATVPAAVTPGPYYVLFVADPTNAVSESDETNNLAALPVTVLQGLANRDQTAGYTVAVAPNPVANGSLLRVQLTGAGSTCAASLDLYNALGQPVHSQSLQVGAGRTNQAEVATHSLATGVYTLRLTGPGLSVTRRVVIE